MSEDLEFEVLYDRGDILDPYHITYDKDGNLIVQDNEENVLESENLVSDSIDYTSNFENIQSLLIFNSCLLIAVGCIIAWCCANRQ